MEEGVGSERWVGYVDWRNRPALKGKHGGMLAASFVLVVEVMENLAFLANSSNLVMYLSRFMHMSPARSANTVTNFMGTAFLLALLGGFLSDAFFTTYHIYLISAVIEFMGLIVLTIQARTPTLKPPACNPSMSADMSCHEVAGTKAAVLFAGLYLVALGVGGIKGSLPAHGAEQFDENTVQCRKQRSTFFNYYVFCLSCGALMAVTLVVWIEDNKGWQWGFGISAMAILLSVPVFLAGSTTYRNKSPTGSPLTTIAKVLTGATLSKTSAPAPSNAVMDINTSPPQNFQQQEQPKPFKEPSNPTTSTAQADPHQTPSTTVKFLNRAAEAKPIHPSLACTTAEVEEVKVVLGILPIFLSTIMLNSCLAQLSTFSVQQAATMETRLGRLVVPPASLPVFPVLFIIVLAPLYDHVIVPFTRRLTKTETGISQLQRIGIGLVMSIIAMAVAAMVEVKRKRVASESGLLDSEGPLPITFLWVALQYLFLGSADLFTLAGLLEFFFTEAPASMRSIATSLSWASLAMGYYLSSVLVEIVNSVTYRPWLAGRNLNHYRLERFYWVMCVLSVVNFMHYLYWAVRYQYRSTVRVRNRGR